MSVKRSSKAIMARQFLQLAGRHKGWIIGDACGVCLILIVAFATSVSAAATPSGISARQPRANGAKSVAQSDYKIIFSDDDKLCTTIVHALNAPDTQQPIGSPSNPGAMPEEYVLPGSANEATWRPPKPINPNWRFRDHLFLRWTPVRYDDRPPIRGKNYVRECSPYQFCLPFGGYTYFHGMEYVIHTAAIVVPYLNDGREYLVTDRNHDGYSRPWTWDVPQSEISSRDWQDPASYDNYNFVKWDQENCLGIVAAFLSTAPVLPLSDRTLSARCHSDFAPEPHIPGGKAARYPLVSRDPGDETVTFLRYQGSLYTLDDVGPGSIARNTPAGPTDFIATVTHHGQANWPDGRYIRVMRYSALDYKDYCLIASGAVARVLDLIVSKMAGAPR